MPPPIPPTTPTREIWKAGARLISKSEEGIGTHHDEEAAEPDGLAEHADAVREEKLDAEPDEGPDDWAVNAGKARPLELVEVAKAGGEPEVHVRRVKAEAYEHRQVDPVHCKKHQMRCGEVLGARRIHRRTEHLDSALVVRETKVIYIYILFQHADSTGRWTEHAQSWTVSAPNRKKTMSPPNSTGLVLHNTWSA
jgi:hypothetical protein